MHILYVTDRLSRRGGADWHLRQVMESAVRAGHRVTVAHGRREPDAPPPPGASGIALPPLASATADDSGLAELSPLADVADVVHVQNVMNPEALERLAGGARLVATVQDHRVFCPGPGRTLPDGSSCQRTMSGRVCTACLPDRAYRHRMLELTHRRRDALAGAHILVLSRYMAHELHEAGLPGAEVLPPWLPVRPRRGRPGDAFLLGGRLVSHKDPLTAWSAWRQAGQPLPLRVAGEGPVAASLHGTNRLGWLDQDVLASELARSRALLFPGRWQEPLGILALQALAHGTPVIVADSGGTRDWSDVGCLPVPPGDVSAMAVAIARLASNGEEALRLGLAGQAMVAERFSQVALEPRLLQLYAEVATHRAP